MPARACRRCRSIHRLWRSQTHQSRESPGHGGLSPTSVPAFPPRTAPASKVAGGSYKGSRPRAGRRSSDARERWAAQASRTGVGRPDQRPAPSSTLEAAYSDPPPPASPVRVARQCRQPTFTVPACLSESSACSGGGRPGP